MVRRWNFSCFEESGHGPHRMRHHGRRHCHDDPCERGHGHGPSPWFHRGHSPHSHGPHSHGPHSHGPHFHGPHFHGPHPHGPHSHGPHHGPHSHRPHSHGPHGYGHHQGPRFWSGPWHHHHHYSHDEHDGPFGHRPYGPHSCEGKRPCCNNEEQNPTSRSARKNKPSCSKDKDGNTSGTVLVQRIVVEQPERSYSV